MIGDCVVQCMTTTKVTLNCIQAYKQIFIILYLKILSQATNK